MFQRKTVPSSLGSAASTSLAVLFTLLAVGRPAVAGTADGPKADKVITGQYECEGVDFSGQTYRGTVTISRDRSIYLLRWDVTFSVSGRSHYEAIGIRTGDVLSATWVGTKTAGVIAYQIVDSKKLAGQWTVFGNKTTRSETLVKSTFHSTIENR